MMTWLLMWLNVSVAKLNATLQLLVIYRLQCYFSHFSRYDPMHHVNWYN